jgi:hypothetical protein
MLNKGVHLVLIHKVRELKCRREDKKQKKEKKENEEKKKKEKKKRRAGKSLNGLHNYIPLAGIRGERGVPMLQNASVL